MIYLALGLVLLGFWLGGRRPTARAVGRGLGVGLRRAGGYWRPTAGLASIALMLAALVLFVREAWPAAVLLAVLGLGTAVLARRRARKDAIRAAPSGMGVEEACAILGVERDSGPKEVQAAYLRLIRAVHPDRGGTRGLAAQLNTARETLLRTRRG